MAGIQFAFIQFLLKYPDQIWMRCNIIELRWDNMLGRGPQKYTYINRVAAQYARTTDQTNCFIK